MFMTRRTIVIGDIHGGLLALEQLLGRVALQPTDRIIFLGDYVDGWSQSAQVVNFLMDMDSRYECIFIRGNHDAWCESWLYDAVQPRVWMINGGAATVESYSGLSDTQRRKHLEFFNRLRNYFVDESNRLYIHAGFSSMHGPEQEYYETNYSWDRTLWEMAVTMDSHIKKDSKLYPKRLLLFHEIFIGHTPTLYYDVDIPMQGCNVWNVDTGAAFHGKLSALDADTKQYWQSDIVQQFYPSEKGRNR